MRCFASSVLTAFFLVIPWSSFTSRESWGRDLRSKFSNNSARSTWSGAVCRRHSSFSACGAATPLMPTPCQLPRGNLTWFRVRVLPRTLWKTMHFSKLSYFLLNNIVIKQICIFKKKLKHKCYFEFSIITVIMKVDGICLSWYKYYVTVKKNITDINLTRDP